MRKAAASTRTLGVRVGANLLRQCGVRRGDHLLVGVSGGADSVALFHLLGEIAPRSNLEIEIAHFDHARRAESADDARWVEDLARAHDVPFHSERWATPRPGEAAARAARHAFLQATASALGCNAIVLAHHRDDQMETILLRLGRGVGLRGALGMAWRRGAAIPVVRPLLDVRGKDLREYLVAQQLDWREDATNASREPARNRVRHDVLPALDAALGPRWDEHWQATWTDLRALWTWVDDLGAALLDHAENDIATDTLDVRALREAPDPVLRAALQRWLDRVPDGAARAHLDDAVRLVRTGASGRELECAGGWRVALEQGRLALYDDEPPSVPPAFALEVTPGDVESARAAIEKPRAHARIHEPPPEDEAWIAATESQGTIRIRTPRPGDRIQLLGAPGHRTLARVLQDHRVPRRLRPGWPVVEDDRGLLWIPGIGVGERARIGPKTRSVLRLRVQAQSEPAARILPVRGLPGNAPGP